jgi:hypothetical protein
MLSKSAITKVKALFIIDVIIVAFASGAYFYLKNTGELTFVDFKPAEFTVTDLTIQPLEAVLGQPVSISANITNIGYEEGSYSVNFTIDGVLKENRTILLAGGNFSIVEFTDIENAEGTYFVEIADLNGTFTITDMAPPSTLKFSFLLHTPREAWVNENVTINVNVTNTGNEAVSYSLPFRVNEVVREIKAIQLSAGETQTVKCTIQESSEGTYSVSVGGLQGSFMIVPTGYHTLEVHRSGRGSSPMSFTLDGVSHQTTYSELLPVGTHTVAVQAQCETKTALFEFVSWNDGDTNTIKEVNLQSRTILIATYLLISGFACCPSLSIWNGTNYVYRAEVSAGTGYLPYFKYFGEKGTRVFGYSDPWDYIKLDNSQIQPKNGYYDMILTEKWDEIFYLDSTSLLVVDHLPDVNVYSTYTSKEYVLDEKGTIYTVSKNPLTPISAVYGGEDALAQIRELDGAYAAGLPEWEYGIWSTLELDLGDLSAAKEIKLIVNGIIVWPSSEVTTEWQAKFVTQPGVPPFPEQYMEVKDNNGNWVRVPDNRQFPMVRSSPDTFVVSLTGLFPTNDYSLRIHTFFDWRFDFIGVDTTPQQDVVIQEVNLAYAEFRELFETYSTSAGNFTRYGDVTELLLEADDKLVIGRRGSEIHLLFPANMNPVPKGMERDYFLVVSCWFKLPGLPYLPYTVDPLPFHAMSCYPYPDTESYPYDAAHLSYLREYNTRTIPVPHTQVTTGDMLGRTTFTELELAAILVILIWIKERVGRSRLPQIERAQDNSYPSMKETRACGPQK